MALACRRCGQSNSAGSGEGPPSVHTDANISVATVAGDDGAPLEIANGRQAYFLAIYGVVDLVPAAGCAVDESTQLERHDAAELRGPLSLRVVSTSEEGATAQVLMVEMQDDGSSRSSEGPIHMLRFIWYTRAHGHSERSLHDPFVYSCI